MQLNVILKLIKLIKIKQIKSSKHKTATITLTDANDGMDKTTIINNPANTTDYEIGHDLVKWIGYAEIPQIYSIQGEDILAFNSLAMNNETIIPLGVYAHTDGVYEFKGDGDCEVFLYDKENGCEINIRDEVYKCSLNKGTHEDRFKVKMMKRTTTKTQTENKQNIKCFAQNGKICVLNMPENSELWVYNMEGKLVEKTFFNILKLPIGSVYQIFTIKDGQIVNNFRIICK